MACGGERPKIGGRERSRERSKAERNGPRSPESARALSPDSDHVSGLGHPTAGPRSESRVIVTGVSPGLELARIPGRPPSPSRPWPSVPRSARAFLGSLKSLAAPAEAESRVRVTVLTRGAAACARSVGVSHTKGVHTPAALSGAWASAQLVRPPACRLRRAGGGRGGVTVEDATSPPDVTPSPRAAPWRTLRVRGRDECGQADGISEDRLSGFDVRAGGRNQAWGAAPAGADPRSSPARGRRLAVWGRTHEGASTFPDGRRADDARAIQHLISQHSLDARADSAVRVTADSSN